MRERSRKYVESTFDNQSPKPERSNTKTNHHHHHRHHHNNNNNKHIENVCLDMDLCASVRAFASVLSLHSIRWLCVLCHILQSTVSTAHKEQRIKRLSRAFLFFFLDFFGFSFIARSAQWIIRTWNACFGGLLFFIYFCLSVPTTHYRLPRGLILVRRRFAFASMHNLAIWISSAARVGIAHQMSTSLLFIFITEKTKGKNRKKNSSQKIGIFDLIPIQFEWFMKRSWSTGNFTWNETF